MGTKNNPGSYDCYAHAAPDEPMFVLLARDIDAPRTVLNWAVSRLVRLVKKYGDSEQIPMAERLQIQEARQCVDDMVAWHQKNRTPDPTHDSGELPRRDAPDATKAEKEASGATTGAPDATEGAVSATPGVEPAPLVRVLGAAKSLLAEWDERQRPNVGGGIGEDLRILARAVAAVDPAWGEVFFADRPKSTIGKDTPRRICLDHMTPAELAIREAVIAIEYTGADPRLTEAQNLLSKAKDLVADFVDGVTTVAVKPDALAEADKADSEWCAQFFFYAHLKAGPMRTTSEQFAGLSRWLLEHVGASPERSEALRKLLEAKDCGVRATMVTMDAPPKP